MVTGVRDVGNKRILMKNKNLCLLNLHQNPTPLTRHASWCSKIAYIERQPIFSGGVAVKSHTPNSTKQIRVTHLRGPHAAALKSPRVLSRNQLTVISVNPSFSTYPHSTILSLNNRIDTRTGQSIISIEVGTYFWKYAHVPEELLPTATI